MSSTDENGSNKPSKDKAATLQVWMVAVVSSLLASVIFLVLLEPVVTFFRKLATAGLFSAAKAIGDYPYRIAQDYLPVILSLCLVAGTFSIGYFMLSSNLAIFARSSSGAGSAFLLRPVPPNIVKIMKWTALFNVFTGSLLLIFTLYLGCAGMFANATFSRRELSLASCATEQEKNEIKSNWGQMRSRSEYENIMVSMEKLASRCKVRLPERRI